MFFWEVWKDNVVFWVEFCGDYLIFFIEVLVERIICFFDVWGDGFILFFEVWGDRFVLLDEVDIILFNGLCGEIIVGFLCVFWVVKIFMDGCLLSVDKGVCEDCFNLLLDDDDLVLLEDEDKDVFINEFFGERCFFGVVL